MANTQKSDQSYQDDSEQQLSLQECKQHNTVNHTGVPIAKLTEATVFECVQCQLMIHHNSYTVKCINCKNSTHLGCLAKGFKEAGGTQPKNNLECIRDFISFSNLVYICTKCKVVDKDVND